MFQYFEDLKYVLQRKCPFSHMEIIIYYLFCSPGDLDILVKQVRAQLKKIAITDKTRVDEMFLRYNKDRSGFIDAANMRNLCRSLQLPVDDDVIAAVSISIP